MMRLYRISVRRHADDLSGEGARRNGGRWTPAGFPALYTAEHPALAAWEKLVHIGLSLDTAPLGYELVGIDVPDDSIMRIPHVPNDPVKVGRDWLQGGETLLLRVPSVTVPHSWNYIVNPAHPAMDGVSLERLGAFVFDARVRRR